MDINEQVEQILKNKEIQDIKDSSEPHIIEGMLFVELATRYNQYLKDSKTSQAYECLQDIARLIIAIDSK
jgi:hypothetical protein